MVHHTRFARPRRGRRPVLLAAAGMLLLIMGAAWSSPASAGGRSEGEGHQALSKKISVCQATGDSEVPYAKVDMDVLTALHKSRNGQSGPVFSDKMGDDEKWGDVIPEFDLGGEGHFGGKNFGEEGKKLISQNCVCQGKKPPHDKPKPPGTKPEKPVPPTKPVVTKPVVTKPATTAPPAAKPTTTVAVKGVSTVAPTTVAAGSLPVTGSSSGLLVAVGLLLTAAGAGVLVLRRRSLG
jgi:LPXTG-motif cell wall-anchored protein